ncbi:MAG TPA: 3-phosphoshikimate 1-carboxyvinyltransferase [Solirubrobacteraceae bacterium]|nr:3-phosphoshikimate 1-carboxyvinyltransferase [Solirubrobacteraceae bacterium]
MSDCVHIAPGDPPTRWHVRVPGSKSITNRALLLAGAASGRSLLVDPLVADDTRSMAAALRTLGVGIAEQTAADGRLRWVVEGLGGAPTGPEEVYCGMGATVGRFLVPMLAAGRGRFAVDAHPQLRRRPLGPVLVALRAQGAAIDGDAFPLVIGASGLSGGDVEVDASVSSQFLSGLLMAAPFAKADTRLCFDTLVSKPYLDLTLNAMRAFGVDADVHADAIAVKRGGYRAAEFEVEPDVSTASYFLASAAVNGTTVRLPGLDRRKTAQGDIELVGFLEQMGCTVRDGEALELTGPPQLRGIEANMGNSSDVFMTLACAAVFADGPTTITGIGHARVKESDRISACAENLKLLGIEVDEGPDYLRVHPGKPQGTWLPTYEDHRIAMAFSLIGTRDAVTLEEPGVVSKTCPEFFDLWRVTGATVIMGEG